MLPIWLMEIIMAHKPHLIEAIFELRWGEQENDPQSFVFGEHEQSTLPVRLSSRAALKGYGFTEHMPNPPIPGLVTHRFRQASGQWPCLQIGTGIFTINQIGNGYNWAQFKLAIGQGLGILTQALEGLPALRGKIYSGLRYQNSFFPDPSTSSIDFLRDEFELSISTPETFLKHPFFSSSKQSLNSTFTYSNQQEKTDVHILVGDAVINGKPGIIMDTNIVKQGISFENQVENILDWCETAHALQNHAYKNLPKHKVSS